VNYSYNKESIVEQELLGAVKLGKQDNLSEYIMVNREEYAVLVEERGKYKKDAEENWQIVKDLEGILKEKNEEIEYLQGQLLVGIGYTEEQEGEQ
jgi:hypothetical protein